MGGGEGNTVKRARKSVSIVKYFMLDRDLPFPSYQTDLLS